MAHFADGRLAWHTFAGEAINLALGETLQQHKLPVERVNDYTVCLAAGPGRDRLETCLKMLNPVEVIRSLVSNEEAERALKFAECVPPDLLTSEIMGRRCRASELAAVLAEARSYVEVSEGSDVNPA